MDNIHKALEEERYDDIIEMLDISEDQKIAAKSQCYVWKKLIFGLPVAIESYIKLIGE